MGTKANIWSMWTALGAALWQVVDMVLHRHGAWWIDLLFCAFFLGLAANRWLAHQTQIAMDDLIDLVRKQQQLILFQREIIAKHAVRYRRSHLALVKPN